MHNRHSCNHRRYRSLASSESSTLLNPLAPGILLTRVWALCMLPSCSSPFYVPDTPQKTEAIGCDKIVPALTARRSFPLQPVLAIASFLYLGNFPPLLPSQPRSDADSSSRRHYPRWSYDARLPRRKSSQCVRRSTHSFRDTDTQKVVQDFSTLPGCYAASVPAIIAGYW